MKSLSLLKYALLLVGVLLATACANRDYPRGQFQGYVIGFSEEEIVAKVGQPAEVDRKNPERPVLIYHAKTFDVENYNKPDPQTRIFLEKKGDKIVGAEVVFG